MKKKLKNILISLIILFAFFLNFKCYSIDMDLSDSNSTNSANNTSNSSQNNVNNENNLNNTNNNVTVTSSPQVQVTSNKKVGLSTEGYISIILIAIGLVLIFLGIAIIIRFK